MGITNPNSGEKYLYFRTTATLADDDDSATSGLIPASAITGMHPTTDTALRIYYSPRIPFASDGQDGNVINNDFVQVNVTANKHKEVMKAIVKLVNDPFGDSFIVIADDVTKEYAHTNITDMGAVTPDGGLS
jgi:hypothetical protein